MEFLRGWVCPAAILLVVGDFAETVSGASVMPSAPVGGFTNSVSFNTANNLYRFFYTGADGTLEYEYSPTANARGSFYPIRVKVNGSYVARPSNVGGVSFWSGMTEIVPWAGGVSFTLLDVQTNGNVLQTRWRMMSGLNSITYTYQFQISGRTLVIQVAATNGIAGGLYLDRSEGTTNAVVIHVPCLTTMNVLYAGGVFTSMFMDWEKTSASTVYPLDSVFSATSVYFAQQAIYNPRTDGTRNLLNETIYLTTSPSLSDVLPNVPNPVSPNKDLVSRYLVFDHWQTPFSTAKTHLQSVRNAGVSNIWFIEHVWANAGFDNRYPDVLPANAGYGGDAGLKSLSDGARTNGYLFGLHENYVDFYTNAPSWNTNAIARNSDGSLKFAWSNQTTHMQSYEMKPSLASNYLAIFAPQIHSNYNTTASFLDVHSAVNPSDKVDYDVGVTNGGMFRETMSRYRALAAQLRSFHGGPVSGEGASHLFCIGYYDDIEAQLNSGSYAQRTTGSWLPLLVDFDLLKLHDKTCVHGVGYYERYFCNPDGSSVFVSFPKDKALAYMAAELAFGHGGFIPTPDRAYDYVDLAKLEHRHVLPAQRLYANAMPVSILYHDPSTNDVVTASDYIRRYPTTFDKSTNINFMSQVRVTYDNGVVVCVNRHPTQPWSVTLGHPGGWFNFNAVLNGTNTQWVGATNLTSYTLPATNGWVVFAPDLTLPKISAVILTNGVLNLGITNLLPGCSNRIERSFSLPPTDWHGVNTFISAGAQTNWPTPVASNRAFYRVVRFW